MSEYTKKNRGEWSEAYTFLKLLSDGKLYAADKDLNKIEDIYYPLIKIITEEENGIMEYFRNGNIKIINGSTHKELMELNVEEFTEIATKHLEMIKNNKSTEGSFTCEEIEDFLRKINHKKFKSKSGNKRDITIVVHDIFTGFKPELGFSIKSKLGGNPTLFNASKATNFIYKIKATNFDNIMDINDIEGTGKIIKRVQEITNSYGNLIFSKMYNENFLCNLQIIDSGLPEIIANLLSYSYNNNETKLTELIKILEEKNPLNYNLKINSDFYKYKIKRFLTDSALGMTATSQWKGKFDATGGYIVVKEDGELVCYHLYNMNYFQDYLLENTKLESPSTSKYDYAKVYEENGEYYFRLNLQIRFI